MRLTLKKRTNGQIEFGIIYGGISLLALCAARFFPVLDLFPSCVFKNLTNFPCPACGSTRAVAHLAHGNIAASLALNPLAALCIMAVVLYFLYSLITLLLNIPRTTILLDEKEKNALRTGVVLLVLMNWGYLVFYL